MLFVIELLKSCWWALRNLDLVYGILGIIMFMARDNFDWTPFG